MAELPEAPPSIAGWRVEEETLRFLDRVLGRGADLRNSLLAGFQISRHAARLLFRAKTLLLVVALLVTVRVIGQVLQTRAIFAKTPDLQMQMLQRNEAHYTLGQLWLAGIHQRSPVGYLVQEFDSPLEQVTRLFSPFVGIIFMPRMMGSVQPGWKYLYLGLLWPLAMGLITIPMEVFVLVAFLVWLSHLTGKEEAKSWRELIWSSYKPLLAFTFVIGIGLEILSSLPFFFQPENSSAASLNNLYNLVAHVIFQRWLLPLTLFLVTLAPFAIIARNLGAWGGVKAGMRLLWQKRWALLGVFVIYRVIYEIILILRLALPAGGTRFALGLTPTTLHIWFFFLLFALLGLWLAMCFMLLVMPEQQHIETPISADERG